ncbi:MAG TPA: hypothetical protein VGV37_03420 [Aliidongia sp.]|uniref:hypothetical protein n=1 Tax=Aliidongia sp. TaxID=1914230 RepID=UPI002DDD8AB2|nr:hypothetical protein [Aliidongia sp.]HEV2673565.1 hypothetical protein [Aliidongia sp.]
MRLRFLGMLPLLAVAVPAWAASCKETAGEGWAKAYVEQCIEVSTATHPPCNVDNPCELIVSEIKRGCDSLVKGGDDVPPYCKPELPPEQKEDAPGEKSE